MRNLGVVSSGVRIPIITKENSIDELVDIVYCSVMAAAHGEGETVGSKDIIGVTESIVAKCEGNFASVDNISTDVKNKFQGESIGVVFPILSRNRFVNILKGIAAGTTKTYVLLNFPFDEVGNPLMDEDILDDVETELNEELKRGPITIKRFREITGEYKHKFTNIDYAELYSAVNDNIEVYVSNDPRSILSLTNNVLVAEIHSRFKTKKRILKADNTAVVFTLSDILSESVCGSGYNSDYGVLGSNLSKDTELKLFPREPKKFINKLRDKFIENLGYTPELLVYGDGAFKDPVCGIWELADPVVAPAYTEGLDGTPSEIKIKFVADNVLSAGENKEDRMKEIISDKNKTHTNNYDDGTTPRRYHDLVGSLCDLTSGSGDKGTPVIWIKGYFDDYTTE